MRIKDIFQVFAYRAYVHAEKFRHELLREPDSVVFVPCFDGLIAGLTSKDQKLGRAVANTFGVRHGAPLGVRERYRRLRGEQGEIGCAWKRPLLCRLNGVRDF